jgi:hypothetical protein
MNTYFHKLQDKKIDEIVYNNGRCQFQSSALKCAFLYCYHLDFKNALKE